MAKPQIDHAFKNRKAPDPATLFAYHVESYEHGKRAYDRIQAAYAKHADEYDAARRWWDRIILEGRAGDFVRQREIDPSHFTYPGGEVQSMPDTTHIMTYAGDQDLLHATMQTLRKWWIRDGRPR